MARRRRNRRAESGMSGLQVLVLIVIVIIGLFLVLRANPELASRLPPDMQRVIDSIDIPREIHIPTGMRTVPLADVLRLSKEAIWPLSPA